MMMHAVVSAINPEYLKDLSTPTSDSISNPLRQETFAIKNLNQNFNIVCSLLLNQWNGLIALSASIKNIKDKVSFKKVFNTYLFKLAYNC